MSVAAAVRRRVVRVEVRVAEEDDGGDMAALGGRHVMLVDVAGDLGALL